MARWFCGPSRTDKYKVKISDSERSELLEHVPAALEAIRSLDDLSLKPKNIRGFLTFGNCLVTIKVDGNVTQQEKFVNALKKFVLRKHLISDALNDCHNIFAEEKGVKKAASAHANKPYARRDVRIEQSALRHPYTDGRYQSLPPSNLLADDNEWKLPKSQIELENKALKERVDDLEKKISSLEQVVSNSDAYLSNVDRRHREEVSALRIDITEANKCIERKCDEIVRLEKKLQDHVEEAETFKLNVKEMRHLEYSHGQTISTLTPENELLQRNYRHALLDQERGHKSAYGTAGYHKWDDGRGYSMRDQPSIQTSTIKALEAEKSLSEECRGYLQKVQKLQAEYDQLQQSLDMAHKETDHYRKQGNTFDIVIQENTKLKQHLSEAQNNARYYKEQVDHLQASKREEYQLEKDDQAKFEKDKAQREKLQKQDNQIQQLHLEIEQLKKNAHREEIWRQKCGKMESQITDYKKKQRGLEDEVQRLNRQLDERSAHSSQMDKLRNLEDEKRKLKINNRENRDKIENLEKDLALAVADASYYKDQNEKLRQEKSQLEEQRQSAYEDNQRQLESLLTRIAIAESQSEPKQRELKDQHRILTEANRRLIQDKEDLEKERNNLLTKASKLEKEHAVLIDRLAAEMNAKISANESSLENISIQARPMKIAEEYHLLMSNAWLDAKSALDDMDPDDSTEAFKVRLLCNVLRVSERQASSMYSMIQRKLSNVLGNPIFWAASNQTTEGPQGASKAKGEPLPQALVNNLGDFLRCSANDADLTSLVQDINWALTNPHDTKIRETIAKRLEIEDVKQFIEEAARLSWKMTIQRPPMQFDTSKEGKPWVNDGNLELMWGSNPEVHGAKIQYYKTPRLLHGGKQMVKATVFVHYTDCPL